MLPSLNTYSTLVIRLDNVEKKMLHSVVGKGSASNSITYIQASQSLDYPASPVPAPGPSDKKKTLPGTIT